MNVVHIFFIPAAARVLHLHDRRIDDDVEILHLFEADGADIPGDEPATRQIFLGRHRDRFRLVQMLQEHFIHLVIAAHHRQHHRIVQFVHDRLHRLRDRRLQIVAHHLNRMLPGRRHEFFLFCIYNAFGNGLRHRRFRIRRKIAMFAIHDIRFPAFRERLKFVRETVSNRAAVCQDRTEMQPATRENPRVRIIHRPILTVESLIVRVKRIAIFHDEFAAAHETETRAQLVAIFIGNLIQGNGELLVRRRVHVDEHRHELLMRRPHAIFAPVPILQAEHFLAVHRPAARFLPNFRRLHNRHRNLLRARLVHFLANDRGNFLQRPPRERHIHVDAAGDFANHPRLQHINVAGHHGLRRNLPQCGTVQSGC